MGASGASPVSHLEVWRPGAVDLVLLAGATVTIGRGEGNGVVLDHDAEVSAMHAVLQAYGGGWAIRDLGSRNGTTVAGERLMTERALRDGDTIRVGRTHLTYRRPTGGTVVPTATSEHPPDLTRREREVLVALCRPLFSGEIVRQPATAKEIAVSLTVTEAAVKQHLLRLYDKFGLGPDGRQRRAELANDALRRGAIGPGDFGHGPPPTTGRT